MDHLCKNRALLYTLSVFSAIVDGGANAATLSLVLRDDMFLPHAAVGPLPLQHCVSRTKFALLSPFLREQKMEVTA